MIKVAKNINNLNHSISLLKIETGIGGMRIIRIPQVDSKDNPAILALIAWTD
jgi:hypothetical protein